MREVDRLVISRTLLKVLFMRQVLRKKTACLNPMHGMGFFTGVLSLRHHWVTIKENRCMNVADSTTERILSWRRIAMAALLCALSCAAVAQPPTLASMADQRAGAVTQVVLGILSYARWPVEPERLHLCVVGPTEYTDDLVKGPTQATGRHVDVQRFLTDSPSIATQCDAVYVGKLSLDERGRLFTSLNGHAVLSISEGGDQCTVGSLFCLRVRDDQVSFEVNLDSVARSGVRIHPSVLQLSRRRAPVP